MTISDVKNFDVMNNELMIVIVDFDKVIDAVTLLWSIFKMKEEWFYLNVKQVIYIVRKSLTVRWVIKQSKLSKKKTTMRWKKEQTSWYRLMI